MPNMALNFAVLSTVGPPMSMMRKRAAPWVARMAPVQQRMTT